MRDVDALVLGTVNASWRRAIDGPTLVACLAGERAPDRWAEHVRSFFEEVPREALFRFMLRHEIPPVKLLATYRESFSPDERHDAGIDGWLADLADAA